MIRETLARIGLLMAVYCNLSQGQTPPPAILEIDVENVVFYVGGTGAFLGARGQLGSTRPTVPARTASIAEDPANRRLNGGGRLRWILHFVPMFTPQTLVTPGGPAVSHSRDFTLVTSTNPAEAGEALSLFASGLVPTVPGVDPGQPFPSTPLAVVNSPVEVRVNGKPVEVLGAAGFPGAVDGYQVNFLVPPDTASGLATIQVSAAWIKGTPINIAVRPPRP